MCTNYFGIIPLRRLQHAEALGVIDCLEQTLLQLLLATVLGQQQYIKARVR